ncbi:hypothetical protein EKO04_011543 [Ascochyta lentis]|uniref:Uncharacterized protein n=1 Tax=Ascochyta lentis TaxID=205686 RepID=A0A8H7MEV9_9PLEO|nr:hypothetical protein EKO04_011543 [Ascochyta lentis]
MATESWTIDEPKAVSVTSRSPRGILIRAQAALSSLSKPVDSWGVSGVPVLSPRHIVPRRDRPGRDSDSSNGDDISPCRPTHRRAAGAVLQVNPIRPLSVSSVSTFGAWMPDQLYATDDVMHGNITVQITDTNSQSARIMPLPTPNMQTQRATAGHQQYASLVVEPSRPRSPKEPFGRNPATQMHSLRMHSPISVSPFPAPATAVRNQDTSTHAQTSTTLRSPQITPPENKTVPRSSRKEISARLRRPVFAKLDVNTARGRAGIYGDGVNAKLLATNENTHTALAISNEVPVPRDVGYVEALRLWYEEKELAAKGRS